VSIVETVSWNNQSAGHKIKAVDKQTPTTSLNGDNGESKDINRRSNNISHNNNFPIFSPINPDSTEEHMQKAGYLDIIRGGHPESPSRLYCILSGSVLKCYSSSPDDMGRMDKTLAPEYELKIGGDAYSLAPTRSGRPQAFALLCQKNTSEIEFLCRNIGAMNQWTGLLKVSGSLLNGSVCACVPVSVSVSVWISGCIVRL
jgi:hypothetical protein